MDIQEFRARIIDGIYGNMYGRLADNYDYNRFSFDGVDRSNQVAVMEHAHYLKHVLQHLEKYYAVYLLLANASSRELYLRLILYRSLGHPHIRIKEERSWSSIQALFARADSYQAGMSPLHFEGLMFGPLRHYENVPTDGNLVKLDCWPGNLVYGLGDHAHARQYYYHADHVQVRPEAGDQVIDCGACFGETAVFFATSVGPNGHVYSFDPLPHHVEVIEHNVRQNGLEQRVSVIAAAVGAQSNHIASAGERFRDVNSPGFSMQGKEDQFPLLSIDDMVAQRGVQRIDYIKMDIEGFELEALKGAMRTIHSHRPKLAISLYHRIEDFHALPLFLQEHFPFYHFYLDHYTIFGEETVLYATPR
ncbi:FkbM family methyltransferase [Pseudoduganella danionis]|uniref:FkbM family methyltransferase n=1 Tax=Pseudoduganella danionis TaxID=1890295 RepID=UPI0035AEB765